MPDLIVSEFGEGILNTEHDHFDSIIGGLLGYHCTVCDKHLPFIKAAKACWNRDSVEVEAWEAEK